MESKIIEVVAGTAGVAGVAIGALILVFRRILAEKFLPQLRKGDAFRLLMTMVLACWTVALAGIAAYAYMAQIDQKPRPLTLGYVGCFADSGEIFGAAGRDLDGAPPQIDDVNMTGGRCIQRCKSLGFSYAGVQYRSSLSLIHI